MANKYETGRVVTVHPDDTTTSMGKHRIFIHRNDKNMGTIMGDGRIVKRGEYLPDLGQYVWYYHANPGGSHKLRGEKDHTDITTLRGELIGRSLEIESQRFDQSPSIDTPTVWITDKKTGRQVQVPLFASREVMRSLKELYPNSPSRGGGNPGKLIGAGVGKVPYPGDLGDIADGYVNKGTHPAQAIKELQADKILKESLGVDDEQIISAVRDAYIIHSPGNRALFALPNPGSKDILGGLAFLAVLFGLGYAGRDKK